MLSTNACGKWSSSLTIQALSSTRSRGLFFKDELWKCRLRIHLDIIYLNGIFKQARRYSCWFLKYCPTVDNGLASISIMHQHNFVFILHNDTNNSNTRQQHLIFLLTIRPIRSTCMNNLANALVLNELLTPATESLNK